jgi:TolB protein
MGDNGVSDYPVAYSPNGKRIAFVKEGGDRRRIFTIGADGKHQRVLPHQPGSGGEQPSFSPDGRRIVYVSSRDGDVGIFSSRLDGSGRRQLTRNTDGYFDGDPCYSPNGKLIAFHRDGNIFIMRADGTKERKLTEGYSPSFSPNGQRIAFVRFFYRSSEIYTMTANGDHAHVLANTQHTANSLNPDYSPNGTQIVFDSDRGGGWGVYTMTPIGKNVRRLTARNTHGVAPAWQPLPRRHR